MTREFYTPRTCAACGRQRLVERADCDGRVLTETHVRSATRRRAIVKPLGNVAVKKSALCCATCLRKLVPEGQIEAFDLVGGGVSLDLRS